MPQSTDPTSDEALASRAARGDRDAFGQLSVRHERRLFRFLSRTASCPADVEDAMQQAMVKAYVNLKKYDPRWKFSTWLYTIALRELRTIGRRAASGLGRPAPLEVVGDLPDASHRPAHDRLADHDDGADLWSLARRVLNPQQYTALWLRLGDDLAPKEIARVMRRPRIWVSVTLHRALAVLRQFAGASAGHESLAVRDDDDSEDAAAIESKRSKPARNRNVAGGVL